MNTTHIGRRAMLARSAGLAVTGAGTLNTLLRAGNAGSDGRAAAKGRIEQSIVYWCFGL